VEYNFDPERYQLVQVSTKSAVSTTFIREEKIKREVEIKNADVFIFDVNSA